MQIEKDSKNYIRVYTYGINESPTFDTSTNNGNFTDYKSSLRFKADGSNLVGLFYNERNEVAAKVSGQLNFEKKGSRSDDQNFELSKTKEFAIYNNSGIIVISDFSEISFTVSLLPIKEESANKIYTVSESTSVNFDYPAVTVIKGCNEILTFNIAENKYYYTKLGAPIVFKSSIVSSTYDIRLRFF